MSSLPTCVQCGGQEYFVESGFYFCAECQIQTQDMREELMSEYVSGTQAKTTVVKEPASQTTSNEQTSTQQRELTSWEVLNYVLKGWINELMTLGVDVKVKAVALQLWVAYLRKLEVAFTSTVVCKKPRLGFTFKSRDAELVYGVTEKESRVLKKAFSRRSDVSSKASSCDVSGLTLSRIRSKKRKALAEALYESESVGSNTSHSNVSLQNLSISSRSSRSTKMCYTADARKTLSKLLGSKEAVSDSEDKGCKYRSTRMSERKSLRHLNAHTVFALLRLALLIVRSPVQLSDIFRWSREGYLSLNNCERLLPSSVTVNKDIKSLLVNNVNSWLQATKKTYRVAKYLNVEHVGVDILGICRKLIRDLHLPDDTEEVVQKLLNLAPPKLPLSPSVNYEGRAAAFIILTLKLCSSLDGYTELHSSAAAKAINKWLEAEGRDDRKLFVWTDWTEALEFRDAVVSRYHIPTRDLWYAGCSIHETTDSFIGQWSMAPKQQTLKRLKEVNRSVSSSLEHILAPFSCGGREPLKARPSPLEQVEPLLKSSVSSRLISRLDSVKSSSISVYFHSKRLRKLAVGSNCVDVVGHLAPDFRYVKKYQSSNVKHRSKYLQSTITVNLIGDLSSSSSDSETGHSGESDDDVTIRSPTKKRKKFSKFNPSSESSLPAQNGNIITRIDLEKTFHNETSPEPIMYLLEDCWRLEGSFYKDSLTVEEFEELARTWFSPSFFWLLKRCSLLIDQSMKDIYYQLVLIEKVCFKK